MPDDVEDMKAGRVVVSSLSEESNSIWYYEDGLIKNQVRARAWQPALRRGPGEPLSGLQHLTPALSPEISWFSPLQVFPGDVKAPLPSLGSLCHPHHPHLSLRASSCSSHVPPQNRLHFQGHPSELQAFALGGCDGKDGADPATTAPCRWRPT